MLIVLPFLVSFVLVVINISLKTAMLTLQVLSKTSKVAVRAGGAVATLGKTAAETTIEANKGALDSDEPSQLKESLQRTKKTARKATNAVKRTGRAAKKTAQAGAKTAKTTGKVAIKTTKLTAKAAKLGAKAIKWSIRALKALIAAIKALITFLLSLGVVGIVILVVLILFLIAAIGGALLSVSSSTNGMGYGSGSPWFAIPGMPGTPGIFEPIVPPTPGPVSPTDPQNPSALYNSCYQMAQFYLSHIDTYSAPNVIWYNCDLIGGQRVGDSCAFFASAYASLVSNKYICQGSSQAWYENSEVQAQLEAAGWKKYTVAEIGGISGLRPGDILVCSKNADSDSNGGHCEVYLAPNTSFGWGRVQSEFPSCRNEFHQNTRNGKMYLDRDPKSNGSWRHSYGVVWRYLGG